MKKGLLMKILLTLILMMAWSVPAIAQCVYVYVYGNGGVCPTPSPTPTPGPSPVPSISYGRPVYSYAPAAGCNGGQSAGFRPQMVAPVQQPQVGEYAQPYQAPSPAPMQYAPEPQAPSESYYQVARTVPTVSYAPAPTYATTPVVYAQPAVGAYAVTALPRPPVLAGPRFRRGVAYGSAHTAAGNYGGGFAGAVVSGPGG